MTGSFADPADCDDDSDGSNDDYDDDDSYNWYGVVCGGNKRL
jgi:hypothetical protein